MTEGKKDTTKQQYEKPRLRTIELTAEEVLAVGCKTATGNASGSPPPCTSRRCSKIGT